MKFDVAKLPLGEALVGFILAAVVVTFVLAFAFGSGSGIEGGGGEEEILEPSARGERIAQSFGCTSCHSTTGDEVIIGPSWVNLFRRTETLDDGSQVVVDEPYLRESIQNPQAKIVQGFGAVMPTFSGLSDQDIEDLIAFIKSLSEGQATGTPTPEASPTATPAP